MASCPSGKGFRWGCKCCFWFLIVVISAIVLLVVAEAFRHPIVQRAANCRLGLGEKALRPDDQKALQLGHVHVVYASDKEGLPGLLMSMTSLARHLSEPENTTIHVIARKAVLADVSELVKCFHNEMGTKAPRVQLLELRPLPFNVANLTLLPFSRIEEGWVRMVLHEYFPTLPRVLWVDNDVLVKADVAPLYRMHMEHPLAAARDWGVKESPGESGGINTGVVVIDLVTFPSKAKPYFQEIEQNKWSMDQAFLNDFFPVGFYDKLDWRWNTNTMAPFLGDEEEFLKQFQPGFETFFWSAIAWLSGTVWEHCQKEVRLLHINFGPFPKYWRRRTLNARTCEVLLPFKLSQSCLGWELPCVDTCGTDGATCH